MFIWNFKKQKMEEGVEPPISNGLCGKFYDPIIISHKNIGETKIISIKDKKNEGNRIR